MQAPMSTASLRRRMALVLVASSAGLVACTSTTPSEPVRIPEGTRPPPSSSVIPTDPSASSTPSTPVSASLARQPLGGVFGSGSEWKRDVSSAPVDQDSSGLVENLARQVSERYGGTAAFNLHNYNVSFITATADTPRADVVFDDCQSKGYTPSQLYDPDSGAHFADVPIPADALPANGTDGELSIWDPATDQLWEFWKANRQEDGWHACWGGRIDDVSTSPGYFPDGMGVAATGLSTTGGSIGIEEMQQGTIDHALSLVVVDAAHYSDFSYPAQRSDGAEPSGTPDAIWEGQRFRLDPTLDVSSLGLSPIAEAVAVAAQRYGFIVSDKGGAVGVVAESSAGMVADGQLDPWDDLVAGSASYEVMKGFPWGDLQALPVDFGKP